MSCITVHASGFSKNKSMQSSVQSFGGMSSMLRLLTSNGLISLVHVVNIYVDNMIGYVKLDKSSIDNAADSAGISPLSTDS